MKTTFHTRAGAIGAALAASFGAGSAALAQPYQITWYTVDGGGVQASTDGTITLSGTIGQPDAGDLTDGTLTVLGGYWHNISLICNDIDFNNDGGFFDPSDIDAFLSVFAEGPCIPITATCDDIDFNNDGGLFDPCDIDAFLLAFAEGPCTPCGSIP